MKRTLHIAARALLATTALFATSCGGNASKKQATDTAMETATETKAAPAQAKGGTLTLSNLPGDEASIVVYKVSTAFADWSAFNAAGGEPLDDMIAVSASASSMMPYHPSASPIALYDYNGNFRDNGFTQSGTFLVQVSVKTNSESRYFSGVAFSGGTATVDWRKGFGPAHDPE